VTVVGKRWLASVVWVLGTQAGSGARYVQPVGDTLKTEAAAVIFLSLWLNHIGMHEYRIIRLRLTRHRL
jgi:hypothetical protein